MAIVHFLNVLEGDCNLIQHDSGRLTMIDVSNAYNDIDTEEEKKVKASKEREERRLRTQVPTGKVDYKQKLTPDNPILYLRAHIKPTNIFRFIITHPDMDHLDGIKDLYEEYDITNTWDSDNKKELDLNNFGGGYNKDDWKFYKDIREGKYTKTSRRTYYDESDCLYWNEDNMKILAPSKALLEEAHKTGDYNDSSYVILFTPPKKNGGKWKILFCGDTHDASWNHIVDEYSKDIENTDVLFAPHHGRDSERDYSFLDVVKPRVTLFGNASSEHLAYDKYPKPKITNNQAGYVVLDITENAITFYVKHYEYARDYNAKRGWSEPSKNTKFDAWGLFKIDAK
jgi:competence protein ComEC